MFELPPARSIWTCKQCGQDIYKSDKKFRSGKNMICNARDGPGGKRDDVHVCPNRVGSIHHKADNYWSKIEYHAHQRYFPCMTCGQRFNKEVYPLCPTCFKLICRLCKNAQAWISNPDINSWICNNCGHDGLNITQVFYTWMLVAKDEDLTDTQIEIRDRYKHRIAIVKVWDPGAVKASASN